VQGIQKIGSASNRDTLASSVPSGETFFMTVNNLSPIEMLDKTLEWFAMDVSEMGMGEQLIARESITRTKALRLMVDKMPELNTTDFLVYSNLVLNKLVKDEYLSCPDDGRISGEPAYSITFEGKIFSKMGGYNSKISADRGENIRLEKIERNQRFHQSALTWLTIILTVATAIQALYAAVILYWEYGWFH
jgi:hypothetical protein